MSSPGLALLRALRALKVVRAECRTSRSGVVSATVLVDLCGKVRRFGAKAPVLWMVGQDPFEKRMTAAQGAEVQRLAREVGAALDACPEWQAELGRRAAAAAERAIRGRANVVASGAVKNGVSRERLLQVVGEAWDLHAVREVMES